MNTNARREKILKLLSGSKAPVSASTLAEKYNVSRQIIVGDIALLRAEGQDITATPRGYLLKSETAERFGYIGTVACNHDDSQMQEELYTVVDFGATVLDVTVEHSIYGQLSGKLELSSRYDVDLFIDKIKRTNTRPLSDLTKGIHIHKIGAIDKKVFDMAVKALKEKEIAL